MSTHRVSPIAKPGSLLKGPGKPRKRLKTGRDPREHDDRYLDALRQCACLRCGIDPCGEAAHIRENRPGKMTGMGEKPSDQWALPLCPDCHRNAPDALHQVGEAPFFQALEIDPFRICEALYRVSKNLEAMRAVVFVSHAIGRQHENHS